MAGFALFGVVVGILGVLYAVYLARWVLRQNPGNEKMQFISQAIATGARAYLSGSTKRWRWF
jgi:K(+)-stimulated pyrophosphate-energized sodium pump